MVKSLRRFGVFVRSPLLFTRLEKISQVVFDKTGTLTMEAPVLEDASSLGRLDEPDRAILREMVQSSLHPVSRALREALLVLPVETPARPPDLRLREEVGMGLVAESSETGKRWTLGRPGWEGALPGDGAAQCEFRADGALLAGFRFRDALREDAAESIDWIRQRYAITILSGDQTEKVRQMAGLLGLPEEAAIGDQSPQEKASFMESLGNRKALYIGDGANDSLAFSRAEARGTPATPHGLLQDKADFYFTGRSLAGLLQLFSVARTRARAVSVAFGFAIAYNIAVVAVDLAGHMHPLLAAILMPLSSLATISMVALVYRGREKQVQA